MSKNSQNEQILIEAYPKLCSAARALLGWSQDDLAERSGIARRTISDLERHRRIPHPRLLREITETFLKSGVSFRSSPDTATLLIEVDEPTMIDRLNDHQNL